MSVGDITLYNYFNHTTTWWLIPLSKWVVTPVINGIFVGLIHLQLGYYNSLTKWDEPPSIVFVGFVNQPTSRAVDTSDLSDLSDLSHSWISSASGDTVDVQHHR